MTIFFDQSPKVLYFNEKEASLGICSPCLKPFHTSIIIRAAGTKAKFDAQSEHALTFQNEEKPLSLSNANIIKGHLLHQGSFILFGAM